MCCDGDVMAGVVVCSYKSKFLDTAIENARKNQTDKTGPLVLDFKIFKKEQIKKILE